MTPPTARPGRADAARRRLSSPRRPAGLLHRARSGAKRSAWRALRHRAFALYFWGNLASSLGTWLQNTAQILLIYRLTHSVFAVGVITCAQFSSSLLLGPWAAALARRFGGPRTLIATQIASAGTAAAMAAAQAAGLLSEQFLVLGALILGLAFTFALPLQTALVPRLITDADTEAAMAMNSVAYNTGRALAPALCVAVVTWLGFSWVFALNAVSYLVFASALVRARPARGSGPGRGPARARDGVRAALDRPRILLLLAMVAAVTFADDPVLVLGPALAHRMGMSSDWAGYFLSALGCGTIAGSFRPAADPVAGGPSPASRRAARSLLLVAAMVAVFALGLSPWLSLLAAFLAGAFALRTGAATQAQLVRQQPARAAAVMGLWAIAWAGSKPLASLIDGWLAGSHGLWVAAVALGTPALLLGAAEISLRDGARAALKKRGRMIGDRFGAHHYGAP